MSRAEGRVIVPRANAQQLDREALTAEVYPDLLITAHGHEGDYGIGIHLLPLHGQTGCHADHVLFGYANVDDALRHLGPELVEHDGSGIRDQEDDVLVLACNLVERFEDSLSHRESSSLA